MCGLYILALSWLQLVTWSRNLHCNAYWLRPLPSFDYHFNFPLSVDENSNSMYCEVRSREVLSSLNASLYSNIQLRMSSKHTCTPQYFNAFNLWLTLLCPQYTSVTNLIRQSDLYLIERSPSDLWRNNTSEIFYWVLFTIWHWNNLYFVRKFFCNNYIAHDFATFKISIHPKCENKPDKMKNNLLI